MPAALRNAIERNGLTLGFSFQKVEVH
jgi:hypothetical protein